LAIRASVAQAFLERHHFLFGNQDNGGAAIRNLVGVPERVAPRL
jgi:hypothetical protein